MANSFLQSFASLLRRSIRQESVWSDPENASKVLLVTSAHPETHNRQLKHEETLSKTWIGRLRMADRYLYPSFWMSRRHWTKHYQIDNGSRLLNVWRAWCPGKQNSDLTSLLMTIQWLLLLDSEQSQCSGLLAAPLQKGLGTKCSKLGGHLHWPHQWPHPIITNKNRYSCSSYVVLDAWNFLNQKLQ